MNTHEATSMIHYECDECGMTATGVLTPSMVVAWADHLDTHLGVPHYGQWAWTVEPLELKWSRTESPLEVSVRHHPSSRACETTQIDSQRIL